MPSLRGDLRGSPAFSLELTHLHGINGCGTALVDASSLGLCGISLEQQENDLRMAESKSA